MKKLNKIYIYGLGISILFLIIVVISVFVVDGKEVDPIWNNVKMNNQIADEEGMELYNRYQVEEGILFNFIGSNAFKDYYGYYYTEKDLELPSFIKNMVLINELNYGFWDYDIENKCYRLSKDEFKKSYNDMYGDETVDFSVTEQISDVIKIDDDSICIVDTIVDMEYTKTIDTYLVDVVHSNDNIIISERVAFIKTGDESFKFYKDSEMKDLVYELKRTDEVDISFINNSELVSNVLLEYADKFDIYTYTYAKGENGYYLESIKK